MVVRYLERRHIMRSQLANIGQTAASPAKRLSAERANQQIRHKSRMPSVAIRERVDGDKTVMQPHRDFVGRIGLVLDPVTDIAMKTRHFLPDSPGLDSDVAFGNSILTCPLPH